MGCKTRRTHYLDGGQIERPNTNMAPPPSAGITAQQAAAAYQAGEVGSDAYRIGRHMRMEADKLDPTGLSRKKRRELKEAAARSRGHRTIGMTGAAPGAYNDLMKLFAPGAKSLSGAPGTVQPAAPQDVPQPSLGPKMPQMPQVPSAKKTGAGGYGMGGGALGTGSYLGLADGGNVFDATQGGVVPPGPPGVDTVPADTSAGPVMLDSQPGQGQQEYVLPADTTEAVGVENLDALKDMTHAPGEVDQRRELADGGVTYSPWKPVAEENREPMMADRRQRSVYGQAGPDVPPVSIETIANRPVPNTRAVPGTPGSDMPKSIPQKGIGVRRSEIPRTAGDPIQPDQRQASTGATPLNPGYAGGGVIDPYSQGRSIPWLDAPVAPTAPQGGSIPWMGAPARTEADLQAKPQADAPAPTNQPTAKGASAPQGEKRMGYDESTGLPTSAGPTVRGIPEGSYGTLSGTMEIPAEPPSQASLGRRPPQGEQRMGYDENTGLPTRAGPKVRGVPPGAYGNSGIEQINLPAPATQPQGGAPSPIAAAEKEDGGSWFTRGQAGFGPTLDGPTRIRDMPAKLGKAILAGQSGLGNTQSGLALADVEIPGSRTTSINSQPPDEPSAQEEFAGPPDLRTVPLSVKEETEARNLLPHGVSKGKGGTYRGIAPGANEARALPNDAPPTPGGAGFANEYGQTILSGTPVGATPTGFNAAISENPGSAVGGGKRDYYNGKFVGGMSDNQFSKFKTLNDKEMAQRKSDLALVKQWRSLPTDSPLGPNEFSGDRRGRMTGEVRAAFERINANVAGQPSQSDLMLDAVDAGAAAAAAEKQKGQLDMDKAAIAAKAEVAGKKSAGVDAARIENPQVAEDEAFDTNITQLAEQQQNLSNVPEGQRPTAQQAIMDQMMALLKKRQEQRAARLEMGV